MTELDTLSLGPPRNSEGTSQEQAFPGEKSAVNILSKFLTSLSQTQGWFVK